MKKIVFLACLCVVASSYASFGNGSFENGAWSPGGDNAMQLLAGSTIMTSWTATGDEIAWIGPTNPWSLFASDGEKFLDLAGYTNTGLQGGVEQSFATVVNGKYKVTFDEGASTQFGNVKLMASAAGQSQSYYKPMTSICDWTTQTFTFTANSTLTTLRIEEDPAGVGAIWSGLDNVNVSAVPEPATVAVLGLGLAALARRRTSRK